MANIPPPVYAPREHAQVQPPASTPSSSSTSTLEFAETTSVTLDWRLSGLRSMYDTTKGDQKSKCIKSAVFGDADNLWEVLWYPNSGVQGGDYASLYLSCVPTREERDQGIGSKWTRKGLWWFRFEIKSTVPDERTNKIVTLATKDASDHTFAVKTANWGWQQFAKRDTLFLHPSVLASDSFLIACTIQAQPQPPAGYWLGLGIPPTNQYISANTVSTAGKVVGSGGGVSAWSGGEGASGGVAGGTTAAGGVRKVVPVDLIASIGAMLDDPLYSDVEFIIPPPRSKRAGINDSERSRSPRRIYANKKLLNRCDYFEAMFEGGFREVEGMIDYDDDEDEFEHLSDSDEEDEAAELADTNLPPSINLPTTNSNASLPLPGATPTSTRRLSNSSTPEDQPQQPVPGEDEAALEETQGTNEGDTSGAGAHIGEISVENERIDEVPQKKENVVRAGPLTPDGQTVGPKKTKVVIRDAAWSTWWAVLYWLYTDTIYFAPLSSSFTPSSSSRTHSRNPSLSNSISSTSPSTRREWIKQWMSEHSIRSTFTGYPAPFGSYEFTDPIGPRPVSAKAVYRLADKLDLPALKLRAFQHICGGLTSANIPAEVFSRFSSTFEDVRKVQVAYFLKHWGEIKKSDTMTQIWTQIRLGKHVGFEEVWPLIVGQLDFKPS